MGNSDAIMRLKNIEGHVRGIERMLEEGSYCIDVLRQIQAVHSALNKVSGIILDRHLNSCVITAIRGDDEEEQMRVLSEIAEIYEAAKK